MRILKKIRKSNDELKKEKRSPTTTEVKYILMQHPLGNRYSLRRRSYYGFTFLPAIPLSPEESIRQRFASQRRCFGLFLSLAISWLNMFRYSRSVEELGRCPKTAFSREAPMAKPPGKKKSDSAMSTHACTSSLDLSLSPLHRVQGRASCLAPALLHQGHELVEIDHAVGVLVVLLNQFHDLVLQVS